MEQVCPVRVQENNKNSSEKKGQGGFGCSLLIFLLPLLTPK